MDDLIIGIVSSLLAGLALSTIGYKLILQKKNKGIYQKEGNNQVAFSKSDCNRVDIKGEETKNEQKNSTD